MVTVEQNIVFSKDDIPHIEDLIVEGIMVEPEGENNVDKVVSLNPEVIVTQNEASDNNPTNSTLPEIRWSNRDKKPSCYVRDLNSGDFTTRSKEEKYLTGLQVPELNEEIGALAMSARMNEANGLEPRSLNEAMKSLDWLRWKEAMDEEKTVLEGYKTWEIMDAPKGVNIVGCRWTYIVKRDASGNIVWYKAQLVTQGFSQVEGINFFNMYAPVAKMATI